MKKSLFYKGLLFTPLPFSANFSSLSVSFSTNEAQNKQAVLSTTFEKNRQIPRWQFDDLALLKAIKDNATRLWNMRRPDRNLIKLEHCRQ